MRPVPGMVWIISIHAPTRGATGYAPEEIKQIIFQSTLPQGERLNVIFLPPKAHYFNPRSHKGSDFLFASPWLQYDISIHAPTRGATSIGFTICSNTSISIHAPTRGATFLLCTLYRSAAISIHAPTRGATTPGGMLVWTK